MRNLDSVPLVGAILRRIRKRGDFDAVKKLAKTNGDVRKVEGYKELVQTIESLSRLASQNVDMLKLVRTLMDARDMLLANQAAFAQGYKDNTEATKLIYVTTVYNLYHTTALVAAECVSFQTNRLGTIEPKIDKEGIVSVQKSLAYRRLVDVVDTSKKYGFKQSITESAKQIEDTVLSESLIGVVGGIAAGAAIIAALLFIARDLVEYFFSIRNGMSKWLDMHAGFLRVNAAALGTDKEATKAKQLEYAAKFSALADKIRVESIDSQREAERAIADSDKYITAEVEKAPSSEIETAGGALL